MFVVTTAPPSLWPAGSQPIGPTDAPPYRVRIAPWTGPVFARACGRQGYAFEEVASVTDAGPVMRELIGQGGRRK